MMRHALVAIVTALAGCAGGGSANVQVDTRIGDWAAVQSYADRECIRAGLTRGQFFAYRDSNISGTGARGETHGDQRIAEFICRSP